MNQLRVVVRRLWNKDGFGIWFVEDRGGEVFYAKPVKLEYEKNEQWVLPEPTLDLPRLQMKELVEQLIEQMGMEGEPLVDPARIVKAKDENLKDLRDIVGKLFTVINASRW